MTQTCGCNDGIEKITPLAIVNRPGLNALAYRVGTHATFLETMKARLSSFRLDVPREELGPDGKPLVDHIYPLRGLTTRESDDPAIALLDAWATVGDVLTFYQERIANEGYLRTATERRSVLELARLISYALRPGVSSSVYLALTLEEGSAIALKPNELKALSVPGPGELPQTFENSEALDARAEWNTLNPRMNRPQTEITIRNGENDGGGPRIYLKGISTNLKVADPLLIDFGNNLPELFRVIEVESDAAADRTLVKLEPWIKSTGGGGKIPTLRETIARLSDAASPQSASPTIQQALTLLEELQSRIDEGAAEAELASLITEKALPPLRERKATLSPRATVVGPLLNTIITELAAAAEGLVGAAPATTEAAATTGSRASVSISGRDADRLKGVIKELVKPASIPPRNSLQLARDVKTSFADKADTGLQLIGAFQPILRGSIQTALSNVAVTGENPIRVYALRVKAAPFGHNAPLRSEIVDIADNKTKLDKKVVQFNEWEDGDIETAEESSGSVIYLDAGYDKILPGSWVVVDTSAVDVPNPETSNVNVGDDHPLLIAKTSDPKINLSRAAYGISGATTRINLVDPNDATIDKPWIDFSDTGPDVGFQIIRRTVVYAQSEALALAEEPIWNDVCGDRIQLGSLVDGLVSGRWLIVSGERTDVPGVKGVKASELVMLSGVDQGASPSTFCQEFPKGILPFPFTKGFYISEANETGDRLVVGETQLESCRAFLGRLPFPNAPGKQMYCQSVELAPGLVVDAYVPTEAERQGDYRDFAGLLIDPMSNKPKPFPGGIIPANRVFSLFAWRIAARPLPARPLDSTIVLANQLAYTYKRDTVTIYANVVKANRGETRNEVLGGGDATKPFQSFTLRQPPLTYVAAPTPAGAESTLKVFVNDVQWHETDTLAELAPADRKFITRTDDEGKTTVVFGDGERGARLPTGAENIRSVYRNGIGKAGNVRAEQISLLATRPLGVKEVINPMRASGGADKEGRDQARKNAPLTVTSLDRLVSTEDYADFARTFAGIGKSAAARFSDGFRELVHVTIAGADDIPIDESSDLFRALSRALRQFGDPFQPFKVETRELIFLVISARVRILPDYLWEPVVTDVRAKLLDTFSFERRELAQDVVLSEVIGAMQSVNGVAYVDVELLRGIPEKTADEEKLGRRRLLTPAEIVAKINTPLKDARGNVIKEPLHRVTANTAGFEAGTIRPAQLAYLTPDVPETLILNQI